MGIEEGPAVATTNGDIHVKARKIIGVCFFFRETGGALRSRGDIEKRGGQAR